MSLALHGGIVHYSVSLANALAPLLPVRIVIPAGAERAGYEAEVQVIEVPVPMEASWREVVRIPRRLGQLPAFIKALAGPPGQVVHFLNRHEYLTAAAPWLRRRLAVTLHDPRPHQGETSWRKLLANWTLRRCARRIFVLGEVLKQHLIQQGVPAERIRVVPHGSFARFAGSADDVAPDPAPTGLFFGRILPYKGLESLLRAAPLIRQAVPDFHLLIAGEGDIHPYRQLLQPELAGGNCELINRFIPDAEMAGLLARCSLVILPYLQATQSGVVPLAYGARRPVVATAVGAIPEIVVEGVTGLLVPPADHVALAGAVIRLLRSPELRQEMGDAGWRYADKCLSWEAIAHQTVQVYQQVLNEQHKGSCQIERNRSQHAV